MVAQEREREMKWKLLQSKLHDLLKITSQVDIYIKNNINIWEQSVSSSRSRPRKIIFKSCSSSLQPDRRGLHRCLASNLRVNSPRHWLDRLLGWTRLNWASFITNNKALSVWRARLLARDGQLLWNCNDLRSRVVCTEIFFRILLTWSIFLSFVHWFFCKYIESVLLYLLGFAFEAVNQIPGCLNEGRFGSELN